jgi:hypothetical protein
MQCFLSNPNWIQVVLTGVTLIVLCVYVYDTRRIAQASVAQAENSQKPFLVLLPKPAEFERHGGGWALDIYWSGQGPDFARCKNLQSALVCRRQASASSGRK